MPALNALLYLRRTMMRNLLWGFVRNLRQLRYLLGLVLVLAYFSLFLLARRGPDRPLREGTIEGFEFMLSLGATLFMFMVWLMPRESPALRFSEAEVAFLFPAPFTRRQLIHYKLCSSMALGLLNAVIMTLVMTLPNRNADVAFFLKMLLGWWSGSTLYFFHGMAAALLMFRLADTTSAVWWRMLVIVVVSMVTVTGIGLFVTGGLDTLRLLLPGRVLVHAVFVSGLEFARWELLLLSLLLGHYVWVLKLETPFEERAIVMAAHRTAQLTRLREGKSLQIAGKPKTRRESFSLHARTPVELVLMWKSLMRTPAYLNRRVFAGLGLCIIVGMIALQRTDATPYLAENIGQAALIFLVYVAFFGPMMPGMDLRNDLLMADQLKAWPLPGWRIVLGSLLAPVLVISAIAWLLLLLAVLGFHTDSPELAKLLSPSLKTAAGLSVALLLPVLVALELVLAYVPVLYFPGWIKLGSARRVFDGIGLGTLVMAGMMLMLLLSLLPPLLAASLMLYLGQWFDSQIAGIILAAFIAFIVMLLEVLYAVHLLGERFEGLDIAELSR